MSKVTFQPSILSRPVYGELLSHGGGPALMLADAEGAEALLDLAGRDAAVFDQAHLIYIPGAAPGSHGARLAALRPRQFHQGPSYGAILPRLRKVLLDAHMGLRVYLAGSEGLIGQATAEALAAGLPLSAVQAEHRGTLARRMQCVHCKGITEGVTTDPFTCGHCGRALYVRDHFSRRLGAFQGVCVDAETPGILPAQTEIRP